MYCCGVLCVVQCSIVMLTEKDIKVVENFAVYSQELLPNLVAVSRWGSFSSNVFPLCSVIVIITI